MRAVPARPPLALLGGIVGSLLAGPLLGLLLASQLASTSALAQVVTIWAFPLAWGASIFLWLGIGVLRVVVQALWNLLRGRLREGSPAKHEALVPPGYGAFLYLTVACTSLAGVVTALATDTPWLLALPAYAACGAGYGYCLRQLAHHGYLPFPETD